MTQRKTSKKSRKFPIWLIITFIVSVIAIVAGISTVVIFSNDNDSAERADKNTFDVENGDGKEIKTSYHHISDNKFFIKIPDNFHTLTDAEISQKYSGDVPDTVFANSYNNVNIAISISNSEVKNEQIAEYLDVMIELLTSNSKILQSDFYEVNKHNVATIKVETESEDEKYYNHMMFFSYEDKLTVIAFNCKLSERKIWENVGDFIINSLYFEK